MKRCTLKFNRTRLAEMLSNHREFRGLTLRKLAKEIGISEATLHRLEKKETPDVDTLAKLSSYFNMSPSVFFEEETTK